MLGDMIKAVDILERKVMVVKNKRKEEGLGISER